MKIVFFGNSDFSIIPFESMINHFEVLGLVTAPDSFLGRGYRKKRLNPVKEIAKKHDIYILEPEKLKKNTELYQQLIDIKADLHVIVSYGKIIPRELIDIPKYGTINLHASLLPKLRGPSPIQYALWQGLSDTGNTVQFITEKMDEGDIIKQSIISINPKEDYLSLERKMSADGANLLIECISEIKENTFHRLPQNHNDATYTKLIIKEDGAVFFSMSAKDIVDAFRALKKNPGIYIPTEKGNIKILDCELSSHENSALEGEIINISSEGIVVSCFEGSILLKVLQMPNKQPSKGKDFANGNRLKIKSVLK